MTNDKKLTGVLVSICRDMTWGYANRILEQLGIDSAQLLKVFGIWYCVENYATRGYDTGRSARDPQLPFGASVLKWWSVFEAWIEEKGGLQMVISEYTERHGKLFTDYMENNDPPGSIAKRIISTTNDKAKLEKSTRTTRIQNLWDGIDD